MELKERLRVYKRKYRNSPHGKIMRKKYRFSPAGIKTERKWRKSNKGKEWVKKYKKLHRFEDNVREATLAKYGKLKPGFEYHHWKPYNKDNFTILEKGFHRFYHYHPELFKNRNR